MNYSAKTENRCRNQEMPIELHQWNYIRVAIQSDLDQFDLVQLDLDLFFLVGVGRDDQATSAWTEEFEID